MALFKSRNNRRSSSSSYASTLTTVVLITICALGVWMLTSNNQDSPPTRTTTTRTSIDTSSTNNYISSSDDLDETTIKSHDPKDTTRVFGHNHDHLPDDPIKFDDKNVNIHAEHEPLKDQSLISEAQLSEESSLTQKQVASDTNEAGAYNYDKKMSESEKLQRISNTEGAEGNQRDEDENARVQDENPDTKEDKNREYQNVNEGETQELNAGQQQEDVRNLDNQESKNEEDEQKQTREDKGDITEEDQKQQDQQQKQDDNSNSYSDTDTKISTSKDSQLEPHTDSQLESQTDSQQESHSDSQQESHLDSQQEPHTDSQLESHTDSQLEPHTDSDSQLESHSDAQLETHTDSDSQLESHTDSQLESQTNSQLESHTDSQLEPHIDSQQESHTDSQLESHTALEGESSQLTQQKETQKLELEKKKKKKLKGGDKDANQSKESKSLSKGSKKSWSTQADQSHNEKERQKVEESDSSESLKVYTWQLCNVTAGADYIPCLDNEKALKQLRSTKHYEHRERHCPEDAPTCLVPLPKGYKRPIEWPASRDKIWYYNVPHTLLAEVKGHQNWVKVTGEFLTFPGGGTQFIHGALHYIDFIQEAEAGIAWGKRTRVILDVGCGVGSFGGYLFERDVVAMSFAPKDEHIAQVQFALERGIPAISAVMGSQRLPFPSQVFDLVHCARCRVPWHAEGGLLLLELNRVLRPGGYFVWSATPVYQKLEEDVHIWNEMSSLTKSMCWELVTVNKDKLNSVGAAIFRKPNSNECYEQRMENSPPICSDNDDPNAAWYVPLQACLHKVPVDKDERGSRWPEPWPNRLHKAPYWLNHLQAGIYGKPASQDFAADDERWKNVVDEMSNVGITWSNVRNVMDMRAVYGGFAAALRDLPVWVINVVNVDSPDTLPIIFERGLFGIYHDWCESFSTYPRTYDLLHADSLFSKLKKRCKLVPVMAEVDRIVRPGGKLIVRDEEPETLVEVENLLKSLHWEITFSKNQEGLLCAKKGKWRPDSYVAVS